MNIFFLDSNPQQCADFLCDEHKYRMIYESCQLLCNAYYSTGQEKEIPSIYKKCYYNHPSSKWVRLSLANFNWLFKHVERLIDNYHKNTNENKWQRESQLLIQFLSVPPNLPEVSNITVPHLAFGATRWTSQIPFLNQVCDELYQGLQKSYKHLQKDRGILNENNNCYIPQSVSAAVDAYRCYYRLKQFKPCIKKTSLHKIDFNYEDIHYKYPSWQNRRTPEWYSHLPTSQYLADEVNKTINV